MSGVPAIEACLWAISRRDELFARLGSAAGIELPGPTDRFELSYADVAPRLAPGARAEVPSVLRVGAGAGALLGVVAYAGEGVRLLAPDGAVVRCDVAALSTLLRGPAEAAARAGLDETVRRAGLRGARADAVRDALLVVALGTERVAEGTRLHRARPSMAAALRAAGIGRRIAAAVGGYVAQLALLVTLWWMVGARALAGRLAMGPGWIAVVVGLVAARLASSWTAGRLAIDGGAVLRNRLLHGILGLETEQTHTAGIGQLMGRVVDTEAIESLALGGGLAAAAGLFELASGIVILALGVAGRWHLALVAVWGAVAFGLCVQVQRALERWSALRLALTHDLVERMVGQRTVVAQEPPELHHRDEDRALAAYGTAGRALDRAVARLAIVAPRGWLVAAIALLAPYLTDVAARPGAFAASLGGVLFVYGALRKLAQAFPGLGAAVIAWRNVAPLFAEGQAASGVGLAARDAPVSPPDPGSAGRPDEPALIAARDLGFRYPDRGEAVLAGCSFEIRRGDRILLEGASGSGKSTLGALLCGLRAPTAGSLCLDGVDSGALGAQRWRARVGAAPQFHENHVFSASLLFNLLLGRAWPPRREDIAEAEAVCRELDLGPLLARMPSGLEQLVGESGWQLSHGERSRLFIARALLQPLEARVLDESFAALDPETLERALACVLRRATTLIVIAHP
jgi:ATP-binding cassette subfamily B protein